MTPDEALELTRLYTADLDADTAKRLLTDDQLRTLLRSVGSPALNIPVRLCRLAAADALEVVARSEALVGKKIRTQDLATDGPAVAAELRAQAAVLRAQAAAELEDARDADEDAGVVIVGYAG